MANRSAVPATRRAPVSSRRIRWAGGSGACVLCIAFVCAPVSAHVTPPPAGARVAQAPASGAAASWVPGVRQAVQAWLNGLPAELRAQAVLPLADADRSDWHYTPRSRKGVSFKQMNAAQRQAVQPILKALLSAAGHQKVTNIIELELVLREMELTGFMRDPERYHLTVYGDPGPKGRWALRFEGHHLSLNFTFAEERAWSDTPSFLGINPARVPTGLKAGKAGLRVLAREEDLARLLLEGLTPPQRARAVIGSAAFGDIVTRNAPEVAPLDLAGLPVSELNATQKEQLRALIREYAESFAPAIAAERLRRVEADFANIRFAWAGSIERGKPHYYRIQGQQFLIEYDASQNGGNHIHTVWRDFNGDFGRDLLKEHYQAMAGLGHGHK